MTREAMQQALEALDCISSPLYVREIEKVGKAVSALRQALEKPVDDPVAWVVYFDGKFTQNIFQVEHLAHAEKARLDSLYPLNKREVLPLYTRPQPAREWVGLTEEDFVCVNQLCETPIQGAEYAQHLLKEKNT